MLKIGFYSIHSEKIIQQLKKLLGDEKDYELHCIKVLGEEEQIIENGAFTKEAEDTRERLNAMDVLLVNWEILPFLNRLEHVRWVQLIWSGVEPLFRYFEDKERPQMKITRFCGPYNQQLSELVISNIINMERNTFDMYNDQKKKHWNPMRYYSEGNFRTIADLQITILGCGDIGHSIARHLKQFHGTVYGMVRKIRENSLNVDQYFTGENLEHYLKKSDYVVNVLPSSDTTKNLLTSTVLQYCRGTVFINIGRGDVIKEEALIEALDKGWFKAAFLDVFEEEPLPKESELWKRSDVFITPHCAGRFTEKIAAKAFVEQLEHFVKNEDLPYLVDWK